MAVERKQVNVRLSEEAHELVTEFCAREGITVNAYFEASIHVLRNTLESFGSEPVFSWGDDVHAVVWQKLVLDARVIDSQRRQRG